MVKVAGVGKNELVRIIIIVDVNIICPDKKSQDYRAHLSDWTAAIRFTHKQISVM